LPNHFSCHRLWGQVREDFEKSVEAILILYIIRTFALIVLGNFVDGLVVVVRFVTLWSPPGAPSSMILSRRSVTWRAGLLLIIVLGYMLS